MTTRASIGDYYRDLWEKLQREILNESDATILGSPPEELAEYYYSRTALQPLELDTYREENIEHRKAMLMVPARMREEPYRSMGDLPYEYEFLKLIVPVVRNDNMKLFQGLTTSTFTFSWSPATFVCSPDAICIELEIKGYGNERSEEQIPGDVEGARGRIHQWVSWVQTDVARENAQLRQHIQAFLEDRRRKIEADKAKLSRLVQKINIPLRRHDTAGATRIRLSQKPIVQRVKPTAKLPEEYVLDAQAVADIIDIIDNMARQFERTPATYQDSREEDLRNTILAGLNAVFAGRATGETFSARGKTDIYLNIDKGNILVCECKLWAGKATFDATIDQLLGYLTWRHNYGIVIGFSRNQEFSKILSQIESIVTAHSSFARGFRKFGGTHFVSQHRLPGDDGKEVELHHLFYTLYVKP